LAQVKKLIFSIFALERSWSEALFLNPIYSWDHSIIEKQFDGTPWLQFTLK
jgi:hypothetical protein